MRNDFDDSTNGSALTPGTGGEAPPVYDLQNGAFSDQVGGNRYSSGLDRNNKGNEAYEAFRRAHPDAFTRREDTPPPAIYSKPNGRFYGGIRGTGSGQAFFSGEPDSPNIKVPAPGHYWAL